MQQAGSALDRIVIDSLRRAPRTDAAVIAWPLVCGSAVAERTRALSFTAGVLQVEVADAGWKRELQSLAPRYVATLNRYVGLQVQRIEFILRAESRPKL